MSIDLETLTFAFVISFAIYLLVNRMFIMEGAKGDISPTPSPTPSPQPCIRKHAYSSDRETCNDYFIPADYVIEDPPGILKHDVCPYDYEMPQAKNEKNIEGCSHPSDDLCCKQYERKLKPRPPTPSPTPSPKYFTDDYIYCQSNFNKCACTEQYVSGWGDHVKTCAEKTNKLKTPNDKQCNTVPYEGDINAYKLAKNSCQWVNGTCWPQENCPSNKTSIYEKSDGDFWKTVRTLDIVEVDCTKKLCISRDLYYPILFDEILKFKNKYNLSF